MGLAELCFGLGLLLLMLAVAGVVVVAVSRRRHAPSPQRHQGLRFVKYHALGNDYLVIDPSAPVRATPGDPPIDPLALTAAQIRLI